MDQPQHSLHHEFLHSISIILTLGLLQDDEDVPQEVLPLLLEAKAALSEMEAGQRSRCVLHLGHQRINLPAVVGGNKQKC